MQVFRHKGPPAMRVKSASYYSGRQQIWVLVLKSSQSIPRVIIREDDLLEVPDSAGAPEEIRTPDPQIRSLVLYPAELRAQIPLPETGHSYRFDPPLARVDAFCSRRLRGPGQSFVLDANAIDKQRRIRD